MSKLSKLALAISFIISPLAFAQQETNPNRILFTNVNVFDGVSESLQMDTNVLIEDNLIASASWS